MKNTESAFNFKAFIRAVAVIAVPVALQNLLTTTGSMVDTMMVAPLGETTVGALGLYFHRKNGLTDPKAAAPLLWGGLPGALLGVLLGKQLGESTLRTCFGVLILLLAARELWLGIGAIRRDGWRLKAPPEPGQNE